MEEEFDCGIEYDMLDEDGPDTGGGIEEERDDERCIGCWNVDEFDENVPWTFDI